MRRLAALIFVALASLAAHDFVDFSVELPVVAMSAILLVAILLPVRLDGGSSPSRRDRWLRAVSLGGALAICIVAATPLGRLARFDAQGALTADAAEHLDRASDAVERHPADYILMGRAAQALMDVRDPRAIAVISRALFLNPKHAGVHRVAATLLLRAGLRSQAQVELSLAIQFAPYAMLKTLVDEISATFPDPVEAARAFPAEPSTSVRIAMFIEPHKELAFEYARRLGSLNPVGGVVLDRFDPL